MGIKRTTHPERERRRKAPLRQEAIREQSLRCDELIPNRGGMKWR